MLRIWEYNLEILLEMPTVPSETGSLLPADHLLWHRFLHLLRKLFYLASIGLRLLSLTRTLMKLEFVFCSLCMGKLPEPRDLCSLTAMYVSVVRSMSISRPHFPISSNFITQNKNCDGSSFYLSWLQSLIGKSTTEQWECVLSSGPHGSPWELFFHFHQF